MDLAGGFDRFRYVMAAVLALSVPPGICYWFIVHPFVDFWRRRGAKATFWFLAVFQLTAIAVMFPFRDVLLGRDLGTSPLLLALSVPILVVSGMVRSRRKKYLTFKTLAGVPELTGEGPGLLREGIYGRIRHPRYVEFGLGCTGWALICNFLGLYVVMALSLLGLYLIVLVEERELCVRFGQDYVNYSAQVPRFIPRRP
jgi:protein-S-isoprenylcysteine O-methyltransferase Ste14